MTIVTWGGVRATPNYITASKHSDRIPFYWFTSLRILDIARVHIVHSYPSFTANNLLSISHSTTKVTQQQFIQISYRKKIFIEIQIRYFTKFKSLITLGFYNSSKLQLIQLKLLGNAWYHKLENNMIQFDLPATIQYDTILAEFSMLASALLTTMSIIADVWISH